MKLDIVETFSYLGPFTYSRYILAAGAAIGVGEEVIRRCRSWIRRLLMMTVVSRLRLCMASCCRLLIYRVISLPAAGSRWKRRLQVVSVSVWYNIYIYNVSTEP